MKDAYSINWQKTFNFRHFQTSQYAQEPWNDGMNALHVAALHGDREVLAFCLERNLDVNSLSDALYTPLHYAAMGGHSASVNMLSNHGAEVNSLNEDRRLPLHLAIESNDLNTIQTLLTLALQFRDHQSLKAYQHRQTSAVQPSTEDESSQKTLLSLLNWLIRHGDLNACKSIHDQRCLLNARKSIHDQRCLLDAAWEDLNEDQPLATAIEHEQLEIINWLLEQGVSCSPIIESSEHSFGTFTALELAVEKKSLNYVLPRLLKNYPRNGGNWLRRPISVLAYTVEAGNTEAVSIIMDDAFQTTNDYAARFELPLEETIFRLVNQPHDCNNGLVSSLINLLAYSGDLHNIQRLIEYVPLDGPDSFGGTPLSNAARSDAMGTPNVMTFLFSRNASTELRDKYGYMPLMRSCNLGDSEKVRLLIEAKANQGDRSRGGSNLLHLVMQSGKASRCAGLLLQLVQESRLDPLSQDEDGYVPLHMTTGHDSWTSFVLNGDFGIEALPPFPRDYWNANEKRPWLTNQFHLFRRRIPADQFAQLLDANPLMKWSPLCKIAAMGDVQAVEKMLAMKPDLDFVGCSAGNALMAACESGRLETVKILVRHGASLNLCYRGDCYSAFEAAASFKDIVEWLLVGRHTSQGRLTEGPTGPDGVSSLEAKIRPWSGFRCEKLDLTTDLLRRDDAVALKAYISWLVKWKRDMRGKIADPSWFIPQTVDGEAPATKRGRPSRLRDREGPRRFWKHGNLEKEDIGWTMEYCTKSTALRG
ncbi:Uu.00g043160.m01.CDS01 [Anthostomella pinea]|uniref:Uu.00g043160.m01.CDS01 n=1 Tax=Anthostomella pinea TaxID=933095 RepID=A0AAI8VAU6_9PEZI|nr:Uu.00g043160.m01.CDS01 [Anthostomella pinea]